MADFLVWDPKRLSVHVPSMDAEHIELVSKMNNIYNEYMNNSSKEKVSPLLEDFVGFTIKHFSDEDAYMESIQYDGLEAHKNNHKHLLGRVQSYVSEFNASGKLTEDFFIFLTLWLTTHIQSIDVKYAPTRAKAA